MTVKLIPPLFTCVHSLRQHVSYGSAPYPAGRTLSKTPTLTPSALARGVLCGLPGSHDSLTTAT